MNRKPIMMVLLACLIYVQTSIAANKWINEQSHHHTDTPAELAFHFEIDNTKQKVNWYMDRKSDAISTFNEHTQHAELWMRDAIGNIAHSQVFANDKKIIEYSHGELKTLNKIPHWDQLASIFAPAQIAQLQLTGTETHFGQTAQVYEGVLNGIQTKICWIPALQIPAYIEQGEGKHLSAIVLKEVFQSTPAHWMWANNANLDDYLRIDASDLGDMESDPFVQRVQALNGHQHAH